jgi:hypothetical protein
MVSAMVAPRLCELLLRYRRHLFIAWLLHAVLLHLFVLGYMTGDGLAYRLTPVIELLQHGSLGTWKYPTDWSLNGHVPTVELAQLPFLAVCGLRGLLVGFPLVVLPLCTIAVFRLVRELTGDPRAAMFAAWAYIAMPMINSQAFAGLIDFVVVGLLAEWLRTLLVISRSSTPPPQRVLAWWAVVTALLTLARPHALYSAIALCPLIMLFAPRGRRAATALRAAVPFIVGALPAISLQVWRFVNFGSPLAPSELRLLGVQLADGVPMRTHLLANGIAGDDAASLATGFLDGWVWKLEWPMGAFYHSQWFAAGFLTVLAIAMVPIFIRTSSRHERLLVVALILTSFAARDFALPRWSYTLAITLVVVVGRSMAAVIDVKHVIARLLMWIGLAVLTVQMLRPEFDLLQIESGHWISPRVDVAASPWFSRGPGRLAVFPDRHARIVIIEHTHGGYTAHLFGRRLTNEVVATVRASELGDRCAGLRPILEREPGALFVDDLDLTSTCARTCVLGSSPRCKLYAIEVEPVRN